LLDDPDPTRQAKARQKLSKALKLTRASLDESRRWVLDLRAAPFLENPLAESLADLIDNFATETELEIQLELKDTLAERRYSSRLEMAIYRIAQESFANIRKHAQASIVQVTLRFEPGQNRDKSKGWLHLIVQDNGKGFDPTLLEQNQPLTNSEINRWGLIGMNERVRFLGGQLKIESSPGQGTRIEATVPAS